MKALRVAAGVVVSLVALFFAFHGVDFAGVYRSLLRANYPLLAASLVLVCLSIVVRARRWQDLFAEPDALHLGRLFGTLNVGYLANNVLPLRAGELIRAVLLGQVEAVSRVETLSTIVVERVLDTLAVLLLLGAVIPLVPVPRAVARPLLLLAAATVVLTGLLLVAATRRAAALRFAHRAGRMLPRRFRSPAIRHVDAAIDGLAVLRSPRAAAAVGGWTVLVYLLLGAAMAALLASFHIRLGATGTLFVFGAATLGLVLPASPGAVGVWEGIVIGALGGVFSVERSLATGAALVSHVIFFGPPMLFGAVYLWRCGLSWKQALGLSASAAGAPPSAAGIAADARGEQ